MQPKVSEPIHSCKGIAASPVAASLRIGLFGGSFNPVTCGHLLIARAALEQFKLDRLVFIPACQSPFKPDQQLAPPEKRLCLLRLALAGWTHCEIDDLEIQRGGVSYTVDTLLTYHQRFPGVGLFYLIGADHAAKLPQWRNSEQLASLAEFIVSPRPGESPPVIPPPFKGGILEAVPMGISASLVRARLRAGLPVEGLVPPLVAEALKNSQMYA